MGESKDQLVLVTGGSGFTASWCIVRLLEKGYNVRTTVRSEKRKDDVLEMLKTGGATRLSDVSFTVADLTKDNGWKEAVAGCTYVLHVASPLPSTTVKDENDLIVPARDGTLRVLRAARDAGVKRVVVTSSFAAIAYGNKSRDHVFDEKDWGDIDSPEARAYPKSKTLAERAAWDFIKKEGRSLELAVINPGAIFGPILHLDYSASLVLIKRLLNAEMPGCPQLSYGIIDVRDVADAHIAAMTNPKAAGERFIVRSPHDYTVAEMSKILHQRLPEVAKKAPTREVPNFVVKLVSLWDAEAALIVSDLGKRTKASNNKAKTILGLQFHDEGDCLQATAEALAKFGLVKP